MLTFILEPASITEKVPGTVYLDEKTSNNTSPSDNEDEEYKTHLKRVQGTTIIMNPQPSDYPADPYNWTRTRKNIYFASLLLSSASAAVIGPIIAPAIVQLATIFEVSIPSAIQLNGSLVMSLGVSAYMCGQLCSIWGKRPLFLLTGVLEIVFCIWAATAQTYTSLILARIFMGSCMGMTYSVAGTASISDVFFVHERGRYVGIWTFVVLAVNNVTPIVSGYLIESLGWRWSFGIAAIMYSVSLLTCFLFMPETGFQRDLVKKDEVENLVYKHSDKLDSAATVTEVELATEHPPFTFKDSLKIYNPRIRKNSMFGVIIRPLVLLKNPVVIWGTLQWCLCYLWVIVIGTLSSQIFTPPPYSFSLSQTGMISGVPPLIGTLIGTSISGFLSDWLVDYLSRKNGGVCESEFRLFMMIPYMVFILIGSLGTGFAIHQDQPWIKVAIYLTILFSGVSFGANAIISYTIDTLNDLSGEAFGVMMIGKSAFVFGLLFIIPTWYATKGAANVFCICGGLSAGIGLLTVPMYIFGKRSRAHFNV